MSLLIYHHLYEDLTMINKVKHSCRTLLWCIVSVEPLLLRWSPTKEICPLCICSHFLSLVIYLYLTRDSRDLGPPTMGCQKPERTNIEPNPDFRSWRVEYSGNVLSETLFSFIVGGHSGALTLFLASWWVNGLPRFLAHTMDRSHNNKSYHHLF